MLLAKLTEISFSLLNYSTVRGIMGEDGLFDQEQQQQMFNGGDGFDQYQYQDGMVMAPPEPSEFPMPGKVRFALNTSRFIVQLNSKF
jgi:hypothetical protein